MDPLAIQTGKVEAIRPVLALTSDLGAVLKEGRVVAGEVMQAMDGRSILIGIGRHRVPADSQVELQPGDRFLAKVEKSADGTVLKVLGEQRGTGEPRLALALRQVLAEDRPVGRLLEDLAAKLRAAIDAGTDPREKLQALFQKLGEHVFLPGAKASDLRSLIARSGLDYEALLLAESSGGKAAVQLRGALGALVKQLVGGLQQMWSAAGLQISGAQLESLGGRLLLALAKLNLGDGSLSVDEQLARLASEIRARVGSAVTSGTHGAQRQAAMERLPDMLANLLGERGKSPVIKALLAALQGRHDPDALVGNLKASLLAALAELPMGEARDSVAKALVSIESEQLLNLARREFSEGWHLSLPVPDGENWATAHLFYADPDDNAGHGAHGHEDMQRITLAVDFTRIGPLRAEIGVREGLVALRLGVSDPQVAAQLRAEIPLLEERLSTGGRSARIAVVEFKAEEVALDPLAMDIRWLREHHLMDLSG